MALSDILANMNSGSLANYSPNYSYNAGNNTQTQKVSGLSRVLQQEKLPEAEVEELGDTSTSTNNNDQWFYQQPADNSGGTAYTPNYYDNTIGTNTGYEGSWSDYYTPVESESYSSSSSSKQEPTTVISKPDIVNIIDQEDQLAKQEMQSSQSTAKAMLTRSAAESTGVNENKEEIPQASNRYDPYSALERAMANDQEQAEAAQTTAQAGQQAEDQALLDWYWRTGQMQLPQNYKPTDSNSGTSTQQEYIPNSTPVKASAQSGQMGDSSPSVWDRIMNWGVPVAYAESDIPVDYGTAPVTVTEPQSGSWKDNFQLNAPILSGGDVYGGERTLPVETEPEDKTPSRSEQARQMYREAQAKTAGLGSLYGNYLSNPSDSYDRFVENGGFDKAAKLNAALKNIRVQMENENRLNNAIDKLAEADGLDPNTLTTAERNAYGEAAKNQVKLVEKTTPEYQRQVIQNRIDTDNSNIAQTRTDLNNLIGYNDNETGAGNLANRNFEPILSTGDSTKADANAISEITLHLANLGYSPDTASYVARYAVENNMDPEQVVQQLYAQQYGMSPEQVQQQNLGGGIREADMTEANRQTIADTSKELVAQGYDQITADNIANYSVKYGVSVEDAAEVYKQNRLGGIVYEAPAYDANGKPNATMEAILNGEFTIDLEKEGLQAGTDYYEVARQGNVERILHLFDGENGFSGLVIPKDIEKFIASSSNTAVGAGKVAVWGENGIQISGNPNNVETVKATGEELSKAVDALIEANPSLKQMIAQGLMTRDDIMNHFFKGITETKETTQKSYSGGGGGGSKKKSYSSGGGRRSGGGGYSSGSGYTSYPSDKEQKQARVNNIMKNWTF